MQKPGRGRVYSRVGWPAPVRQHFNCHSQGISVGRDRVVTSCTDRRKRVGWLQIYETKDSEPFADPRHTTARRVRLYGRPLPHPAVGQALQGQGRVEGSIVIPIVHEQFGRPGSEPPGAARIDLRDGDGRLLCHIEHEPEGGLAAVAATVHDDFVWVFAVSRANLFVYRLPHVRTDGESCGATLTHRGRPDASEDGERWRRYQALAVFSNERGELFLLGSARHRLDTWAIGGLQAEEVQLDRLAQLRWKPPGVRWRGVFYEGMTIEPLGPSTMRIWALPHDYWRGACRPVRLRTRCTRAVYAIEQELGGNHPG